MTATDPRGAARRLLDRAATVIATAGGAGYAPVAPGTCGTVVAVPLAWLLGGAPASAFAATVAAITLVGVWAAARADRVWGTHDAGRIVIDEVGGYLATIALLGRADALALAVAFVVFRLLDILKPWPIRWLDDQLPGGWGVVLDDVAAGVIGGALMLGLDAAGALPGQGL